MSKMFKTQLEDGDLVKLIKEVKKRPCIWNPHDQQYSMRFQSALAWVEISKKLNKPEDVLRNKWKNLRDFFKKEIKKYSVESADEYCGKWRHFKSMEFMLKVDEPPSEEIDDEPQCVSNPNSEVVYIQEPSPEKRLRVDDDDDYDMMFLKSLTPFLKQLEPTRNLVVRNKIQDMLLNEIAAQNGGYLMKS